MLNAVAVLACLNLLLARMKSQSFVNLSYEEEIKQKNIDRQVSITRITIRQQGLKQYFADRLHFK